MNGGELPEYRVTLTMQATAEITVRAADWQAAALAALAAAPDALPGVVYGEWLVDEAKLVEPVEPLTVNADELAAYARLRAKAVEQGDTF